MVKTMALDASGMRSLAVRTVAGRVNLLEHIASTDTRAFRTMITSALADRSPAVRGKAVLLVTEHKITDVLPLVVRLLRDKSADVRYDAAESVGLLRRDTRTVYPALRSLLSDKSALVRIQAVESLALIGDQSALPKIVPLLSDHDPIVRSYAATTIADLNGSRYAKRVEKALRKERNDLARAGLLEALFLFGKRGTLPELLSLLTSRDYHVRCSAANALEFLPLKRSELTLAIDALRKASYKPMALADASTVKRVLKRLKRGGQRQRGGHNE
jgi:HEAT repeat protein